MLMKSGLVVADDSVVVDTLEPIFLLFLRYLASVFKSLFNTDMVITSGRDGTHAENSLHNTGRAVDLRTNQLTPAGQVMFLCVLAYLTLTNAIAAYDERRVPGGEHVHLEWYGQ
jgi:hypothetical protein